MKANQFNQIKNKANSLNFKNSQGEFLCNIHKNLVRYTFIQQYYEK
ncbi:TPA: hypothetical protein RTG63_001677 [Campylobacter jejuni]|nr:hypothetical protein [Campylobacter jejuni]